MCTSLKDCLPSLIVSLTLSPRGDSELDPVISYES
jgi:hypothetical protein